MSEEMTREDLVAYCEKNDIKYHGNAGFNTLKELVDNHIASLSDDGEDDGELEGTSPKAPEQESAPAPDAPEETPPATEPPEAPTPVAKKGEVTLLNIGKNPHSVAGKTVLPGESIVLTKAQCKDERLMAKIETAIRCNVLEEVE